MRGIHILNGDALTEGLRNANIAGQLIICRECLIDGPCRTAIDNGFWELRANFIKNSYGEEKEKYYSNVVDEFNKLEDIQKNDEVSLWFENDLFCQANYWFTLKLLSQLGHVNNAYRVFPLKSNNHTKWNTFGNSSSKELVHSFENRKRITPEDINLGIALWDAYSVADLDKLLELSLKNSHAFQFLDEVVRAHTDRFPGHDSLGRPHKTLKEIIGSGQAEFNTVFKEFSTREAIYGFGDIQVMAMLDQLS